MCVFKVDHCYPRTVGFSEIRFEKWGQLAILDGFDPDNENQVAIVCGMLSKNRVTFPAATIVLFPSRLAREISCF